MDGFVRLRDLDARRIACCRRCGDLFRIHTEAYGCPLRTGQGGVPSGTHRKERLRMDRGQIALDMGARTIVSRGSAIGIGIGIRFVAAPSPCEKNSSRIGFSGAAAWIFDVLAKKSRKHFKYERKTETEPFASFRYVSIYSGEIPFFVH